MKSRSSIALGFLVLIGIGAVLLSSPWARTANAWGGFGVSLFTACSAVCVTGLTVVEIVSEYTLFGQIVLLVLVELGCLGLMTCGTFLMIAIGRRLSLSREFSLMNAYGVAKIRGVHALICWIVGSMLVIEGVGAVALYLRWGDVYRSIFFSVMSFCNSGFSIEPGSVAAFADDPMVVLTLALETILGGIGFLVIYNLCTFKFLRRPSGGSGRLSLHARVSLRFTAYLLAIAFVVFLFFEWRASLAGLPVAKRLWVSFFQAVTPRTCGYCIIPTESLQPVTRLIYEALMFIGGAPGSAAAGMKVTTLAILIHTLRAMCRGESETIIDRKVIPMAVVRESLVIMVVLMALIATVTGLLFVTDAESGIALDALFFEAVSAITTTGLSVGDTTARLSEAGRAVVMLAMFCGRLGALTVVMMIGDRESSTHIRYPSEEIVVG